MFTVTILQRATVKRPNIIIIAHEQVFKFYAQPKLVYFLVLVLVLRIGISIYVIDFVCNCTYFWAEAIRFILQLTLKLQVEYKYFKVMDTALKGVDH